MHNKLSGMVEVFKTNVTEAVAATEIVALLMQHFPGGRISFDLEDCDKVLRIEGVVVSSMVIRMVAAKGYECQLLT